MLVVLVYVAIFTPFQAAFLSSEQHILTPRHWMAVFVVDRFVDAVCCLDVFVQLRSAWVNEEGIVVFDQYVAATRYLQVRKCSISTAAPVLLRLGLAWRRGGRGGVGEGRRGKELWKEKELSIQSFGQPVGHRIRHFVY